MIKDKSNGGGLKKSHVEKLIKIPLFPDYMQENISNHYFNDVRSLGDGAILTEQKKRNEGLGIFQLNMEVLALRERLADLVSDIIIIG